MNNQNELHQLDDIRKMMIRSSRFISLSGLSGIFAGIFALAGAAVAYAYMNGREAVSQNLTDVEYNSALEKMSTDWFWFFIVDAGLVLLLSVGFGIFFTTRKARRDGLKIWDLSAKRLVSSLMIPLITGGIFCIILLMQGPVYQIAPAMLIFYGLALVNGSNFSVSDIKYLGILEVVLGLTALLFPGKGLLFWAIGFGVLHILYGIIMYVRYER